MTHSVQGIYSDVACPGLVLTQMTLGILGKWFWMLILPLLLLVSGTLSHVQCISDDHNVMNTPPLPPPPPPPSISFLHQNLIHKIENLGCLQLLDTLNLSNNMISKLENLRKKQYDFVASLPDLPQLQF